MPTPLAHTGFALAVALGIPRSGLNTGLVARQVGALVVLANLADVDFAPGLVTGNAVAFHHGFTHSFLFAGLAAFAVARVFGLAPWRAFACAASHPVLDWLTGEPGADVARYGVALFWPWPARFMSDAHVFGVYHIDRLGLLGGVLNLGALEPLSRELVFVVGCMALGLAASRPGRPVSP